MLDVDVTEVFGISEISALTILSEVGADMTKWKTEHHFTSWLGLAPNTKISGGKIIIVPKDNILFVAEDNIWKMETLQRSLSIFNFDFYFQKPLFQHKLSLLPKDLYLFY